MLPLSLQSGFLTEHQSLRSLSTRRSHSTAATKASAAYLKTQQLFEDDRQFALQQQHLSSPRIAAAQQSSDSIPAAQQRTDAPHTHKRQESQDTTLGRSSSGGLSVADSVSSYHGYSGVNYQSGKFLSQLLFQLRLERYWRVADHLRNVDLGSENPSTALNIKF